jgi:hypothetical protein
MGLVWCRYDRLLNYFQKLWQYVFPTWVFPRKFSFAVGFRGRFVSICVLGEYPLSQSFFFRLADYVLVFYVSSNRFA